MAKMDKKKEKKANGPVKKVSKPEQSSRPTVKAHKIAEVLPNKSFPLKSRPPPPAKKKVESSSESSSEESSEDERPKSKKMEKDQSSSSSDSDDSDSTSKEETTQSIMKATLTSDSSSDAESSREGEPKNLSRKAVLATSSSDSSESDSTSEKDGRYKVLPKSLRTASSSESSSESDSSCEKNENSSDSDSSSEGEQPKALLKSTGTASSSGSGSSADSDSSEDEDEEEKSSEDESDDNVEKVHRANNGAKRKSEIPLSAPLKKVKLANGHSASAANTVEESKSVFVGRLSWSIDNDRLAEEFAECGEVERANVMIDHQTGNSRGFGYVHFTTAEAAKKALELSGKEIDGRAINVDLSTPPAEKDKSRQKRAAAFGDKISPPSSTLFVGNLSFSATEDMVWSFFTEYGVKNVRLPTDRETGRPKGFGYVEFENTDGAQKAFSAYSGAEFEGRSIRLDYSQPRDAAGGGRGGRDNGGRGRGRGGERGFRGRGSGGGGGDRGWRGRGSGGSRGNFRSGGIASFAGKKTTF